MRQRPPHSTVHSTARPPRRRLLHGVAVASVVAGLATAATASASTAPTTPPDTVSADTVSADTVSPVVAGKPFPDDRCAANHDAGTISYLTGFDYAAAASMIDVFVAEQRGYYDDLCLDVKVTPSFSTDNYPVVAAGRAQFASAGSFTEMATFAVANDADLVALVVEGRSPADVLILKPDTATTLTDLRGDTIGVKGKITPSVAAMLAGAGLVEGRDYQTVLLDGFDPVAQIALDGIVGFPGYRSNEPGTLERAGIPFQVFDPIDDGVPGSFGVIYTTRSFVEDHPSAVEDFVRATMRGLNEAIADPDAAAQTALDLIDASGNPNFLSPEGEAFRWQTESATITADYADGDASYGVPDPTLLQAEVDAYDAVGLFGDAGTHAPTDLAALIDTAPIDGAYGERNVVVWPA